jgi:uncharacterized membrane protein
MKQDLVEAMDYLIAGFLAGVIIAIVIGWLYYSFHT